MTEAPIFDAATLRRHVESYLAEIPPGHGYASLEYRVGGELHVSMATRIGDHWSLAGSLAWNLRAGRVDQGSVRVVGSWS